MVGAGRVKMPVVPKRPVASRVKMPDLYPKGAGLVGGYVFTLTANGTQWALAKGVRGRDIPAKADGRGNVVLASGAQISVTGLNILRAGGDRAPAPAPVVLPALPPEKRISPDKYARRVVPEKKAAEKEWGVMVGAGRVKIGVRDAFPVLGGGLIETDDGEGGGNHRPFVVVEVAPDKVRPFYMSTGTGGQTASGEWNLFGGIAEQSGRVSLGWFIKPTEGKRVEKYAAVSAFLAEKFGEDSDTAWRRIQRALPGAKVYSELVGGELPTEETPRRVERRKRRRVMGGLLNSYLGKLNAIAAFQPEFEPEVGQRRSAGEHKTVYGAGRVAFNPLRRLRNASEGERHISYEEQERRRKLYAPSREKEAERRRLRAGLAVLLESELGDLRVSYARKKGTSARPPKPVYTREYLASKGMKRRNPLEAYQQRAPDGTTFQRVYVGRDATLDIEFSQTDWSHPGAPKTVRILPSSRGHRGVLVRNLTNRWSTADEVLTAAVAAEASADDMFSAYPRYEYRDAAHYYEALTEVLTEIAATLQRGWRS
jgi:hypothetical protein